MWSSSASSHKKMSPPPSTPPPFHPSSTPPLNINNFLLPLPTTSLINPPSLKDTSIPPSYTPPPLLPSSTPPSLPVATIEWFKNIITCHTSRHFSQVCLQNQRDQRVRGQYADVWLRKLRSKITYFIQRPAKADGKDSRFMFLPPIEELFLPDIKLQFTEHCLEQTKIRVIQTLIIYTQ